MSSNPRKYNCKDEELPVIGSFVLNSFKKDLADFTAHSPLFDESFLSNFESQNTEITELVTPAEETAQLKVITARLNTNLAKIRKPLNLLADYLDLAEEAIPLSAADFGIQPLRQSIKSGDVEGVIRDLAVLNRNITRYTDSLTAQGLKPEIVSYFAEAASPLAEDNSLQHTIVSQRQQLVEENIELMNALYATIRRVCKTAKALYKSESPAKVADYTFSRLKKEVRHQTSEKNQQEA